MTALQIKPAVREQTHILASLAGPSGCGKTYSALLMARGIAGPTGKIGFIDTEAKRARHYADLTSFDVMDMAPPFSPLRYLEAVKAFADAGYKVLVIDSISHEWEGTGGCIEIAEQKAGKGLLSWQRPKAEHKKLMNYLLQVPMHVIFCARAREKMVQVTNPKGETEIVNQGWHAIAEKNFIFEMTVSMILDEQTKIPTITKCPAQLLHAFPAGQRITSETGDALRQWAEQGVSLDRAFEELKQAGRDAADLGLANLKKWYLALSSDRKAQIKPVLDTELKSIADEADRREEEARSAAEDDPFAPSAGQPVRGISSPAKEDAGAPVESSTADSEDNEPDLDAITATQDALAELAKFTTPRAINNWFDTSFAETTRRMNLTDAQVKVVTDQKNARVRALTK